MTKYLFTLAALLIALPFASAHAEDAAKPGIAVEKAEQATPTIANDEANADDAEQAAATEAASGEDEHGEEGHGDMDEEHGDEDHGDMDEEHGDEDHGEEDHGEEH